MTEPLMIPHKIGFVMRLSETEVAMADGFEQKGHLEHQEWSPETRQAVKEAHEIIKALEANPHINYDLDGMPYVEEPVKNVWVPEETHEEWLQRWRETR